MTKKIFADIEKLKSKPISLHLDKMQTLYNGIDTVIHSPIHGMKLIIYSDSLACTTCAMSKMYCWNDLLKRAESYGEILNVHFIFSPKQQDLPCTRELLSNINFKHVIHLDTMNVFSMNNSNIPNNPAMHSFLLDENNNVILVGNPLTNKRIEELL